jgi:hypothetical protein
MFRLTPIATAVVVSLSLTLASGVHAQGTDDPFDTRDEMENADPGSSLSTQFDLRLRLERTTNIPARTDDIERFRARLRAGLSYLTDNGFELGAAAELAQGSDDNVDNKRNKDNEKSDSINLDQLYARYFFGENTSATVGKTNLTLTLSPLVWDQDLRPIGLGVQSEFAAAELSNWRINAGYFAPDFVYDNRNARLAAVQVGYQFQPGAPDHFSVWLGYLRFSDLNQLPAEGIGRTNRRIGTTLVSDYELLDLQFNAQLDLDGVPVQFRADGLRNLGAKDQRDAGRVSLSAGDAATGGFEMGFAYQRAARDAVLAVAADDDWWFQSFARGGMPWFAYGFDSGWGMRLSGFDERRDGISKATTRVLFDVSKLW